MKFLQLFENGQLDPRSKCKAPEERTPTQDANDLR